MTILALQQSLRGTPGVRWLLCCAGHCPHPSVPSKQFRDRCHPSPPTESFSLPSIPVCRTAHRPPWEKRRQNLEMCTALPEQGQGGGTDGAAAGHMWLPPALMLPTWDGGACDSHSASGEKWEACGKQEEETHRGEGNSKLLQPPLRKMWTVGTVRCHKQQGAGSCCALVGHIWSWVGMGKSSPQPPALQHTKLKAEPKGALCPLSKRDRISSKGCNFTGKQSVLH